MAKVVKTSKPKARNNRLADLINWRGGLFFDLLSILFFLGLNFVYLIPFLGESDKSNVFSAPLIPLLADLLSLVTRLPLPKSIVIILMVFLVTGPVSLYYFAKRLTDRRLVGFTAALFYSLPTELLARGRIRMAFLVGDGAHLAALTLIPMEVFFLIPFLRTGNFKNLVWASLCLSLVALTSPFGLLLGMMFALIVSFSEVLQGEGRLKILRLVVFLVVTMGLVAFWYNPGFVKLFIISRQGQSIFQTFWNLVPLLFVVVPVFGAFGFLLFEKRNHLQPLFIAFGLAIMFALVSFADHVGALFPSHPRRYLPILGFSFSFLLGILLAALSDYLRFKGKFYKVRLTPLGRSLARKGLWLSTSGFTSLTIALSLGTIWELPEGQVLGLWNEDYFSGSLWEIRHQVGVVSEALGYLISLGFIILMIFGWQKIKKQLPPPAKTSGK